jgi:hypothetical protein
VSQARWHRGITDASALASTKIMTDTQAASTKIHRDAEALEARLLVNAEIAANEIELARNRGSEAALVIAMATGLSAQLSDKAYQSIDAMVAEANAVVALIRRIDEAAINEIHVDAINMTKRMLASDTAAARMKDYKADVHTLNEVSAEGVKASNFATLAAEAALLVLHRRRDDAIKKIRTSTNRACADIKSAVERAVGHVEAARIKGQARIDAAALPECGVVRGAGINRGFLDGRLQ